MRKLQRNAQNLSVSTGLSLYSLNMSEIWCTLISCAVEHSWLGTPCSNSNSKQNFEAGRAWASPNWLRPGLILNHTLKWGTTTEQETQLYHGKAGGQRREGPHTEVTGFTLTTPTTHRHFRQGNWAPAGWQKEWAMKPTNEPKSHQLQAMIFPLHQDAS